MRCECGEHDMLTMVVDDFIRTPLGARQRLVIAGCRDYWHARAEAAIEDAERLAGKALARCAAYEALLAAYRMSDRKMADKALRMTEQAEPEWQEALAAHDRLKEGEG